MERVLENIHFRSKGKGYPIVLLHASPMDSTSMMPLMEKLTSEFMVIAPDTPGYGGSLLPLAEPADISYYADQLAGFLRSLELEKVAIYGTATGAQIAIRTAIMFPDLVEMVFLDNVAHFTDSERAEIFESYFPDFTPAEDGSHLPKLWENVVGLFEYFPWSFRTPKYKLQTPLPPMTVLDMVMKMYIQAGKEYDWAYRAAFEHEKLENLLQVSIPVHIFRWESSILKPYSDRLFERALPLHFTYTIVGVAENRYELMANVISEKCSAHPAAKINLEKSSIPPEGRKLAGFPGSFPVANLDGSHWLEAWGSLGDIHEINERTEALLAWAKADN